MTGSSTAPVFYFYDYDQIIRVVNITHSQPHV